MKKNLVSLVVVLSMLVSLFSTYGVYAQSEKVEIKFTVGDSTLTINGQNVEVEKPYVVGVGVTLVPVRVITEAFGAKVDWENDTQTVTLTYPDVNIVLQIGNPVAEINGRAETLLAPPELTGGYTMVPLRFISENFGAEVSYNEETEEITVVKSADGNMASTVAGQIQSKYIGDSFYGWSMENPTDMVMEDRDFDGRYTVFAYDNNNYILIEVSGMYDEYNFDTSFNEWKNSMKGLALTKADKDVSVANVDVMHFQAKDKAVIYDVYEFATEDYIYCAYGEFAIEDTEVMNEGLRLLSTFGLNYSAEDTHDLSNVKDGVRRFEAESVKFAFDVPQNLVMTSDESSLNDFIFEAIGDDDYSSISACIYSKDSVKSALDLAKTDHDLNYRYLNSKVAKMSGEPTEVSYKNFVGYEYTIELNTKYEKWYSKDVFFELGDYVYNIRVTVNLPDSNKVASVNKILNSVSVSELDFNVVGTIMRNDGVGDGYVTIKELEGCEFRLPAIYTQIASEKNRVAYSTGNIGVIAIANIGSYEYRDIRTLMSNLEKSYNESKGTLSINSLREQILGSKRYLRFTISKETDVGVMYVDVYATNQNGNIYVYELTYKEKAYSSYARNEFESMFANAVYK